MFWCSDGGIGCFDVQMVVLGVLVFRRWYWVFWFSDGGTGCFDVQMVVLGVLVRRNHLQAKSRQNHAQGVSVCVCVCVSKQSLATVNSAIFITYLRVC